MVSERVQRQIDRLLDQAEEAMGQMAWGAVRDCSKAVLALDSSNNDAIAFLASAEQVLGTDSTASEPLDNPIVTESTPSSPPTSFANDRYFGITVGKAESANQCVLQVASKAYGEERLGHEVNYASSIGG